MLKNNYTTCYNIMNTYFKEGSLKKINVAFSGGGIAGLYQGGVSKYVIELYRDKKIDIEKVYGTSCGSLTGVMLIYAMINPNFNYNEFIDIIHNQFKTEYMNQYCRVLPAFITILDQLLPNDIHEACSNKLHIGIMVKEGDEIIRKTITQFNSKQDILNAVYVSSSIPILTIWTAYALYNCPSTKTSYPAIDGIFTPLIECSEYETLYVNILKYNYSYYKRLIYWEKSYKFMLDDGYNDASDVLNNKRTSSIIYFYEKKYNSKHKQYLYLWTNKLLRIMIYIWFTIFA